MEPLIVKETDTEGKCVKVSGIKNFDVDKIFDCGQSFRFNKVENSIHKAEYSGVAMGKFVSFGQDGEDLYIYNSTVKDYENIWKKYLCVEQDYGKISEDIKSKSGNEALASAIEFGKGIRILKQDEWEAICSFIVSQNNNIPRIKKIIEAMSKKCGERIEISEEMEKHVAKGSELYSFPTPKSLAELGVDGIFALKTGFRAKYIYDAATKAENGEIDFEFLEKSKDTASCIKELCNIKGVGPKVASCALLFGFAKYDAFPIDVWIKKVIVKYFTEDLTDFSPEMLGDYAGIAQQYLFYYERYLVG